MFLTMPLHLQLSSEEIEALHPCIRSLPGEPMQDLACDDCDQVYQHGLQLAKSCRRPQTNTADGDTHSVAITPIRQRRPLQWIPAAARWLSRRRFRWAAAKFKHAKPGEPR